MLSIALLLIVALATVAIIFGDQIMVKLDTRTLGNLSIKACQDAGCHSTDTELHYGQVIESYLNAAQQEAQRMNHKSYTSDCRQIGLVTAKQLIIDLHQQPSLTTQE